MKILLITAYFPPEVGSASHLFYELGSEFVRSGHHVTVITGYPRYNMDMAKLGAKYRSPFWMKEEVSGMQVVRIRTMGMPRQIPVLRGVEQITSSIAFFLSGLLITPARRDAILIYSPPLFLGLTGIALRMFGKGKVVLNIQDLFPQSAIDLGVLRNRILIKAFRFVESYLYDSVDVVAVHSPGNRSHVLSCGGNSERTIVAHNPVDLKFITPGARLNAFREQHGIDSKTFVVSFAGVLGYSQDLDTVIDAAGLLADREDIVFYIVGDGVEKSRLMKRASELRNVRFLPMLPRNEYAALLHASDLCLVTLHREVKTPVVPSKILSIMAAARPMVVSLPLDGDAPGIVREAEAGICIAPGEPVEMAKAIGMMYKDPCLAESCGKKGRLYAEEHFSLEGCATSYLRLFENISSNTTARG